MCDRIEPLRISKREFLRTCAVCAAGIAAGMSSASARGVTTILSGTDGPSQDAQRSANGSKEALFWERTSGGIRCRKCPHECLVADGETGFCRNRVNRGGTLYSTAYGNPCAVHIDPIEKKPFFHVLPATRAFSIAAAGCNLRCLNCQNWQISQVSPAETINDDLPPAAVVAQCVENGCASVAYTYSEPTSFYEYVLDTAAIARERKVRNLLKSNGYINEQPLRRMCKHLDAANIDLKCYDDGIYKRLSGGSLAPLLTALKTLKDEGVWVEITNLVIPSWTDDLDMIRRMCDWLAANGFVETPLHFSRFMPLYKLTQLPLTPVSVLEQARAIAMKAGIQYVYIGNVPDHEAESTRCAKCGKVVVERHGFSIRAKHLKDGRCEYCRTKIPGVWD